MSSSKEEFIKEYISAGDIKNNYVVLLKDKPCKVTEIKTSKTGKHGHAKATVSGYDVLTDNKVKTFFTTDERVPVPKLNKDWYGLLNIDLDENMIYTLDSKNTSIDFPFNCDEDIRTKIIEAFNDNENEDEMLIDVLSCMGKIRIVNFKKQQAR